MSGLENMKRQILDEANHSAEEQISKARTKAEEILREAREQMEEQSAVMAKKVGRRDKRLCTAHCIFQ